MGRLFSILSSSPQTCMKHFQAGFPHKRWVKAEEGTTPSLFLHKDTEKDKTEG